jgi:ABC-type amino acid transport substrate-binding protein
VRHAQQLGCRAFRFSIAWARVEPQPGEYDPSALEHYRAIVYRLRELEMEPIVTLCHFVWPQHIEHRGGLRSDEFADWFAAYTAHVRAALDPHVRYWLTFNEPNILLQGFYKLWFQSDYAFPPGQASGTALPDQIEVIISVIRHLFEAHTAARCVLRRDGGEHNLVSANVFQLGLPPVVQRLINWNITHTKRAEDWRDHFWRAVERPAPFARRYDAIVAPASIHQLDQAIERLQNSGFDTAHFVTGLTALVKRGDPIDRLDALDGKHIAFVRGPSWEKVATVGARLGRSRIGYFDTYTQACSALNLGQSAAVIADELILKAIAQVHSEYRVIGERFVDEAYLIAIEAGQPALREAVQRALDELATEAGRIEISRHVLARDRSPSTFMPLPIAPRHSSLGRLQQRGRVIVGVQREDVPWFDVTGTTTERIGIEFDVGRMLAGVIFGDPTHVEFRRAAPPRPTTFGTRLRRRLDEWLRAWTIFSTFVSSTWWYLGMRGELPEYLCPHACVDRLDFVAFDYYFGVSAPTPGQLRRLALSIQREFHQTAIWAGGLHQALRYYHALFPGKPIVIAENGFADAPAGHRRAAQLAAHVRAVQRAVSEGIDVRAYCVWSITSNREWGLPQSAASDFGLYYIDLQNDPQLTRHATSSAEVYRRLIEGRGAT